MPPSSRGDLRNLAYEQAYRASLNDPEGFWRKAAEDIDWFEFPPVVASQHANGVTRWFAGGKLNISRRGARQRRVRRFKRVLVVPRLPKTRSGKILRQAIRQLADGEALQAPATIDDPAILDEIAAALGKERIKR